MSDSRIRVAFYVRVSTSEQDLGGQLRDLRSEATRRGWEESEVYPEKVSATGRVSRAQYDRLLRDARAVPRPWDHLLVWALDRFSREERFTQAVEAIWGLERGGVHFHSLKEPILDTPENGERSLPREIMLGILPTIAAYESRRRSERVRVAMRDIKSGLRSTRSGKAPGRQPKVTREHAAKILKLREEGLTFPAVAQRVGLPAGTCRRVASLVRRGLPLFKTPSARKDTVSEVGSASFTRQALRTESSGNESQPQSLDSRSASSEHDEEGTRDDRGREGTN